MHRPLVLALTSLAIPAVGCGLGSSDERALRAASVQREVEAQLNIPLRRVKPPDVPAAANVRAGYIAGTRREDLLVLIFDSSQATLQVTGSKPLGGGAGPQVVAYRNVVVLYEHRKGSSNRTVKLAAALRSANAG